jgi:hypothetical protein
VTAQKPSPKEVEAELEAQIEPIVAKLRLLQRKARRLGAEHASAKMTRTLRALRFFPYDVRFDLQWNENEAAKAAKVES